MSTRHLECMFSPRSLAVFGASDRPLSIGATVWRNLAQGYRGTLYPVNLRLRELDGHKVLHSVADLPQTPDLAVICTPPATLPLLIAQLGARGTKAAVVVSAGLTPAHRRAMLQAARPHTLRILGPNCIGMIVPHLGLNASFAHAHATPGTVAFVSQSSALVTAMLDWAHARQIGFSHFVSLGEHADVDFGDMLDYLGSDPRTRAILLYIESIHSPRKFMSAARAAARNKPVIVIKAGRTAQGSLAATSHTGALAGSDEVFDAAISRAGMLRVFTLQQLFLAAELLARFRDNRSEQLVVLTNGGGPGVMATDAADSFGLELARLNPDTVAALDRVLPANWSRANPVDIGGDAPAQRYVDALKILRQQTSSAILLVQAPSAIESSTAIAEALAPIARENPPRVLSSWLGHSAVQRAREIFREAGILNCDTPEEAVQAYSFLRQYRRHQVELMETPAAVAASGQFDLAGIRDIVAFVLADGRQQLTEPESKELLRRCGIPATPTQVVPPQAPAAVYAAETLGYPVALKILSHDITHKSDVGGVRLDLHSAAEVMQAADAMLERVATLAPQARIEGFSVQPMVRRQHAHELIVGASVDPAFGPVILFGQGGTAVEVVADRALALPPLNSILARSLIERTRISQLLRGYRDVPRADHESIVSALLAVSQLLAEVPEIAEIDINPLVVYHDGAMALDARVRLSRLRLAGAAQFAIRPYPQELVEYHTLRDGRRITLRPIKPEDEAQHRAFLERIDPEDIRMRFFYSRRSLEHSEMARLTQIDYEREMAFIATWTRPDGGEDTLGAVRGLSDPNNDAAEYGVLVRSDLKGQKLGYLLMDKLIRYLSDRGTKRIIGTVLRENSSMLGLVRRLGFSVQVHPEDSGLRHVELALPVKSAGSAPQ